MIRKMARLRLIGLRDELELTLRELQELGVVHLAPAREGPQCSRMELDEAQQVERERMEALVLSLEVLAARLGPAPPVPPAIAGWEERAEALRAELEALDERARSLDEERVLLEKYRDIVAGFAPIVRGEEAQYLLLRGEADRAVAELRRVLGEEVRILTRPLDDGQVSVAIVAPAERLEPVLAELQELPAPAAYGGGPLSGALPAMMARLQALPSERANVAERLDRLVAEHAGEIAGALAHARDRRARLDAVGNAVGVGRTFVLEGWVPEEVTATVEGRFEGRSTVAVERVGTEDWQSPAPVELSNPAIFRPFEMVTRMVPLPAYGTLDPTPFVAVSFPLFFGIILGDVGYGVVLGIIALFLKGSLRGIAAACAVFTIIFGFMYGELFGDLVHLPAVFRREEAIVPALVLAVGIGVVHIVLGLVLGAVSAFRKHPRRALGRSLAAAMVVLLVLALLAVVGVLPSGLFTPLIIAALIAFPLIVAVEGLLGVIEMMSTFSHILSYIRIMAVGTASVLMAVVANRLAGAMGSVLVGVLFALLFHLVNFALGIFGPAVHTLRLHYVEFFGEFYSPGGIPYDPFRRS